jgi:hypothetical protein
MIRVKVRQLFPCSAVDALTVDVRRVILVKVGQRASYLGPNHFS